MAESVIVFGSVYAGSIIKRFIDFQPILAGADYMYSKALVIALATVLPFML
jgi:hypothetical protein